jgi:hypothetical protein
VLAGEQAIVSCRRKRIFVDAIVRLSRLPLSSIVLFLSVALALVELAMTWHHWRSSDRIDRIRGIAATIVLTAIAALTWIDGARVDGLIATLYGQVRADTQGIIQARVELRKAARQLAELRVSTTHLAVISASATAQVSRARASVINVQRQVSELSTATTHRLSALRSTAEQLANASVRTTSQIRSTQSEVGAVDRRVTYFATDTSRQLQTIETNTALIAAKAGVFHLQADTMQDIINVLARAHGKRAEVVCVPGLEAVCGDFDSVFRQAHWTVETWPAESLWGGDAITDRHGVVIFCPAKDCRLSEQMVAILVKAGLDAILGDSSHWRNPPDMTVDIKFVHRFQ